MWGRVEKDAVKSAGIEWTVSCALTRTKAAHSAVRACAEPGCALESVHCACLLRSVAHVHVDALGWALFAAQR